MNLIEIFVLIFFVFPTIIIASYHLFLGGVGLTLKRKRHQSRVAKTKIAVLIPAHNEEMVIEKSILSVQNADYPQELRVVYVVADNCTDKTDVVAEKLGARVIVRNDSEHRGKGHALNDAIPKILKENDYDGIFFMDADSRLDNHTLRSIDYYAQKSHTAPLQVNNVADFSDETPLSYFFAVGNCLENDFFYAPKSFMNLFSLLRGTGMYFPREIAEEFAWNPESLVEDTDLTLELLKKEIPVTYLSEANVFSEYPEEKQTMQVQRKRWIGGTLALSLCRGIPLLVSGLFTANKLRLDAGLTLLMLSRPLIVFQLILTTLLCFMLIWPLKTGWGLTFLIVTLLCWLAHLVYFSLGVVKLGLTLKRIKMLVRIPQILLGYLLFSGLTFASSPSKQWERTPRKSENPQNQDQPRTQ